MYKCFGDYKYGGSIFANESTISVDFELIEPHYYEIDGSSSGYGTGFEMSLEFLTANETIFDLYNSESFNYSGLLQPGTYRIFREAAGCRGYYNSKRSFDFDFRIGTSTGSVNVIIEPQGAIDEGAQWRFDNKPDTEWYNSGDVIQNLISGTTFTVRFKDVYGWKKPENQVVKICEDSTNNISGIYEFLPFHVRLDFLAGPNLISSAVGDLNSDGTLENAAALHYNDQISVLIGNGDGSFQTTSTYETGERHISLSFGDLNVDGNIDVTVANYYGGKVSVLLGNGDGSFQVAVNYSAGIGPWSLAPGDIDYDGNLDLAVAKLVRGGDYVSMLPGRGDRSFREALKYIV
jgi:hypothetical protein